MPEKGIPLNPLGVIKTGQWTLGVRVCVCARVPVRACTCMHVKYTFLCVAVTKPINVGSFPTQIMLCLSMLFFLCHCHPVSYLVCPNTS